MRKENPNFNTKQQERKLYSIHHNQPQTLKALSHPQPRQRGSSSLLPAAGAPDRAASKFRCPCASGR